MKRSIQILAACAMIGGFAGSALAQATPTQHQQHQQHVAAPAASQPATTQPPGTMSGMMQAGQQPGAHQADCDCCQMMQQMHPMMQQMHQMMQQMHQMHQMMQGHGEHGAAPQGDEHQRHQAERPQ